MGFFIFCSKALRWCSRPSKRLSVSARFKSGHWCRPKKSRWASLHCRVCNIGSSESLSGHYHGGLYGPVWSELVADRYGIYLSPSHRRLSLSELGDDSYALFRGGSVCDIRIYLWKAIGQDQQDSENIAQSWKLKAQRKRVTLWERWTIRSVVPHPSAAIFHLPSIFRPKDLPPQAKKSRQSCRIFYLQLESILQI